jgi:hypothetical protein
MRLGYFRAGYQRTPTRLTGPPRFIGLPGRTTARATGRGRSTTPGLTTHPTGYATYEQYTMALARSVLAATNPVISSTDSAIENFILVSSTFAFLGIGPIERPALDAEPRRGRAVRFGFAFAAIDYLSHLMRAWPAQVRISSPHLPVSQTRVQ